MEDDDIDPRTLLPRRTNPTKDEAWAAAIEELGKQYPVNNQYFLAEAVHGAYQGWRSTAWNNAIKAGIPVEHLRAVYNLIWE